MDKIFEKKQDIPVENKTPFTDLKEIYKSGNLSLPKQDMIMPQEFNSVSDPVIHNNSITQSATYQNSFCLS